MSHYFVFMLWLAGVACAFSPIASAASGDFNLSWETMLNNLYGEYYKDVAIFSVAVLGTAFADAFETFIEQNNHLLKKAFALFLAVPMLVLAFFIVKNVGPHLSHALNAAKLPYQFLVASVVFSLLARLTCEA